MARPIEASPQVGVPEKPQGNSYTVRQGDTLADIAKAFYGDPHQWTAVWEANENKIKDPFELKAGTRLTIPVLAEAPEEQPEPASVVPAEPKDQVDVSVPKADPKMAESVLPPAEPKVITLPEVVIVGEAPKPPAPPPKKTYVEKTFDDVKYMGEGVRNFAVGTVKTPYHLGSAGLETVIGAGEGALGLLKAGATLVTRGKADTDLLKEGNESLRNAGSHAVKAVKAQGQALKGIGQYTWGQVKAGAHTVGMVVEGWAGLLGLGAGLVGKVAHDSSIGDTYRRAKEIGRAAR